MPITVYIETSVISYRTSRPSRDLIIAAHQQITHEWWTRVLPTVRAVISGAVLDEIERGDTEAAADRRATTIGMEIVHVDDQARELATAYYKSLPIPESARADTLHLALASLYRTDYLVTWNCRHLANEQVRRTVGKLNATRGLVTPNICTPEEMLEMFNAQRPDHRGDS